ncbi:PREDICTED: perilipin-3-like, partial [Thamnophis sirtalis]|uniref:Perilipin-3-like n=1 Tax=Thamnophis sirtalis TaxID=35019 RepID=A0A6I9YIZ3_9SAUR
MIPGSGDNLESKNESLTRNHVFASSASPAWEKLLLPISMEAKWRLEYPVTPGNNEEQPSVMENNETQQDVLSRATSLPLVSSTYEMAASAYTSTKENHPYVKVALDLAEKSVKHVSEVAMSSAQPFLNKLEPQEHTTQDILQIPQEEMEKFQQMEYHTLATSYHITEQLQIAYINLMGSIQGLPSTFQQNIESALHSIEELQATVTGAQSFKDLSSNLLIQSKKTAVMAQKYVDDILDYVGQNIPLSWLVGPFVPALKNTSTEPDPAKSNEREVISETQELVSSKVADAKDAVAKAVQDGKEMFIDTKMGKLAISGVEAVLEKSGELLDHYLPMTDEELAQIAQSAPEGVPLPPESQGYFVKLGSLSTKLQHRAYRYAVVKMEAARENIQNTFSQLRQSIGQ